MKLSPEERFRKRMLKIGKKNMFCRTCIMPVLVLGTACFHGIDYCKKNVKRFSMIAVVFLLFVVYSSFSFPGLLSGDGTGNGLNSHVSEEAANITLAVEADIDFSEISILDDADVIPNGEYAAGTAHGMGIGGTYSTEDILDAVGNSGLSQGQRKPVNGEKTVEFSRDDWRLLLVNKQNSIPDDYEVTLGSIQTMKGTMQCDERIIEDLLLMQQAAKEEGISLEICSPHRDFEYQQMLFNRKIRKYLNLGMSYMEAYQLASQAVMVPGASEHQLGLALDIVTKSYTILDEGFADTPAGKWLAENSCKYGFIVRYPKGKEYITGVEYEPWHFRYVGVDAAMIMTEEGITLEEFWEEYL